MLSVLLLWPVCEHGFRICKHGSARLRISLRSHRLVHRCLAASPTYFLYHPRDRITQTTYDRSWWPTRCLPLIERVCSGLGEATPWVCPLLYVLPVDCTYFSKSSLTRLNNSPVDIAVVSQRLGSFPIRCQLTSNTIPLEIFIHRSCAARVMVKNWNNEREREEKKKQCTEFFPPATSSILLSTSLAIRCNLWSMCKLDTSWLPKLK